MIKYNAVVNKYLYKSEDIDKILGIMNDTNYYNPNYCTQENISTLIKSVNDFMSNIETVSENAVLERHETEAEAREYFGEDFIAKFDQLLSFLDKQETIVALHGTTEESCKLILDNGLQYKIPSLSSTAVQQRMAYGQHDMHYDKYESLLNWEHKNYKGLAIIAIPYECYYKEGLWNKFQDTNSGMYGGQDYRIDPDFVAGYIDVTQKKIVLNPKYNRKHNYDGYLKDNEIFRQQIDMDNNKFKQMAIESEKLISQEIANNQTTNVDDVKKEQFDASRIPYVIEDLVGTFNSIKNGFPDGMTEERYKGLLKELANGFNGIVEVLPTLKTNEQVNKEMSEKYSVFNDKLKLVSTEQADDFDWGDDIDWNISTDQQKFR